MGLSTACETLHQQSRTTNSLNQIATVQATAPSYDSAGDLTADDPTTGERKYVYDSLHRVMQILTLGGTLLVSYVYDALNRRIQKTVADSGNGYGGLDGNVPAGVTSFLYDGPQIVEEQGSGGSVLRQHVWGQYIDEKVQQREYVSGQPSADYYVLSDLLFRSVALTNSSQCIIEAYDTDAYGHTIVFNGPGPDNFWFTDDDSRTVFIPQIGKTVPANPINRHIFTGREDDVETRLHYYRARYLYPDYGRFTTRDPIGYAGGMNLYEYVGGRPSAIADPHGLTSGAEMLWEGIKFTVRHPIVTGLAVTLAVQENLKTQFQDFVYAQSDPVRRFSFDTGQTIGVAKGAEHLVVGTMELQGTGEDAIRWLAMGDEMDKYDTPLDQFERHPISHFTRPAEARLDNYLVSHMYLDRRSYEIGNRFGELEFNATVFLVTTATGLEEIWVSDAAGELAAASRIPIRVTQYYDPRLPFPVEGQYALAARPGAVSRYLEGLSGETTWVAPRPASQMTAWRRLMTGVGGRRSYVEFDVFPGELRAAGGLKRLYSNYQQIIPGRVSLIGRNPTYGVSSFNYLHAGVKWVGGPAILPAAYYTYKGSKYVVYRISP